MLATRLMRSAALLLLLSSALAQQPPPRPRIGLTLAGGSALGLSHVGVIEWLEKHRIPVHFVSGTSIGGLVGGLYAAGYDSAEIKEFVRSIEWEAVFNPQPPFQEASFRRKEDRREFPNRLELGFKKGLNLPAGLASGHEVSLVISRFAAPYAEMASFNDLPTPFRCVATDLLQGEQVIFSSGNLSLALRATMSLPGIFSPVAFQDKILADGGMLNNLPVDVTQSMGADFNIAVALIDPPAKKSQVGSVFGIARRSLAVMVDGNQKRNMVLADILIAPELDGLDPAAFAQFETFERRGFEAAERKKRLLSTLSVSEDEWQRYVEDRRSRRRPRVITPERIEVAGVGDRPADEIRSKLESALLDHPLDRKEVEGGLTQLVGSGLYSSAPYSFVQRSGKQTLLVDMLPKAHGPPFLNSGLSIDGSDTANIRLGLGARLTWIGIGNLKSEWRTDFTVGVMNSASTEYYFRIGNSLFFLAPRAFASQRREDLYEGTRRSNELSVRESGFGVDGGIAGGRFSEVRLGYIYQALSADVRTGGSFPELDQLKPDVHSIRLRFVWDSQDSPVIPRKGLYTSTEFRWNLVRASTDLQYGLFEQRISIPKSFGKRYIALGSLAGGTILGPRSLIPPFALGGPTLMSAFGRGQFRGERYYFGSALGLRAFSTDAASALNRAYFAIGYEMGSAFYDIDRGHPAHDGVIGVASETPVGTVFMGGSFGTNGNRKFFFRLGRLF